MIADESFRKPDQYTNFVTYGGEFVSPFPARCVVFFVCRGWESDWLQKKRRERPRLGAPVSWQQLALSESSCLSGSPPMIGSFNLQRPFVRQQRANNNRLQSTPNEISELSFSD